MAMKSHDVSRRQLLAFAGTSAVVGSGAAPTGEPSEYPVYKARGTHRELGRQHGEQASRQITAHIEMMRARPKLSDEQFRRRVAQFQPMFERYCPTCWTRCAAWRKAPVSGSKRRWRAA